MNRQLYAEWIREVRGKISQSKFGENIYHYKTVKNEKKCYTYHRNEIRNWEAGKNLPKNIETFISIALFDFDKQYQGYDIDMEYRNARYNYVDKKMQEILGERLYARSMYDALLIQVCRGILSFEEVLELEVVLETWLKENVSLELEQKKQYANTKQTEFISGDLLKINTKDEIFQVIQSTKEYFYTADRTLGERLQNCFEKEEKRYTERLSLGEAVRVYAPNYRDSFHRIFTQSGITREWLIDLCIHLRFSRVELQYVLENAHLIPLAEGEEEEETFYIYKKETDFLGSAKWYQYMEKRYPNRFKGHFFAFQDMGLVEKFQMAVLICSCVEDMEEKELPPIDYILESFLFYEYGKEAIKEVEKIVKMVSFDDEWEIRSLHETLKEKVEVWIDYIEFGRLNAKREEVKAVYEAYRMECAEYFSYPAQVLKNITNCSEVIKIKYISGLLYTIFTGTYYHGNISQADLNKIKKQFENSVEEAPFIYNFLNAFFVIFLSDKILYEKEGRYYTIIDNEKTMFFDMEEVYTDLWESLLFLISGM